MPKNILVINSSSDKNYPPTTLFEELGRKNYYLHFWAKKSLLTLLFYALRLFYYKRKKRIDVIICCDWKEKIVLTIAAKLLGLKIIWLENPAYAARGYNALGRPLLWLYKFNSRWAKIITFNGLARKQLQEIGIKEDQIKIIQPGVKLSQREHQDNIFSGLARADVKFRRKFFTLGAITELDKKEGVETLLRAVEICSAVIPNIQLIVVGDGKERKNLVWLAKKMGIDSISWFVGEQNHLKKWLDNFDVFILTGASPAMIDFDNILKAMNEGLPAIGPRGTGLENVVYENKTGVLIENGNSEMLARQIIKLYQDKRLRLKMGELAKERVKKYFTLERQLEEFEKIL
ncbi:glycosyltransferase family 4 protein [Candidatus Falkowbacteria bacterium]|nr:glycosyltransferase family 4 protein [Candidatus Falkowbacteria bacterium]